MKLSVYVEGRIPAIVVPEGRQVRFRLEGSTIEVLVGDSVISTRPDEVGCLVRIGVVPDDEPSDARVQAAIDEESLFGTELDELREENIQLRAKVDAQTAAAEAPSGLIGAPVTGLGEQLGDPAQIDLVPPVSGNPDAPTGAEGPES